MKGQVAPCLISHMQADIVDFDSHTIRIKVKIYPVVRQTSYKLSLQLKNAQIVYVDEYMLHKKGNYPFLYDGENIEFSYNHQPKEWHLEVMYQIPVSNNPSVIHNTAPENSYQIKTGSQHEHWSYLLPRCFESLPKNLSLSVALPHDYICSEKLTLQFLAKDSKKIYYLFDWNINDPEIYVQWKDKVTDVIALNTVQKELTQKSSEVSKITKEAQQKIQANDPQNEIKNKQENNISTWVEYTTQEEQRKKRFYDYKLRYDSVYNQAVIGLSSFGHWGLTSDMSKYAYFPLYEPINPIKTLEVMENEVYFAIQKQIVMNEANRQKNEGLFNSLLWKWALYRKHITHKNQDSLQVFLAQQFLVEEMYTKNLDSNELIQRYAMSLFNLIKNHSNSEKDYEILIQKFIQKNIENKTQFTSLVNSHLDVEHAATLQYFIKTKELHRAEMKYTYTAANKSFENTITLLPPALPMELFNQEYHMYLEDKKITFAYTDTKNPSIKNQIFESRPQTVIPTWAANYPIYLDEKRSDAEALYELSYIAQPYNRYRAYKHLLKTKNKNLLSTAMSLALDDSLEILKTYAMQGIDQLDALGVRKVQDALTREIKKSGPYERANLYKKAEKIGLVLERPLISTQKGLNLYADLLVMHLYEDRKAIEMAKEAFIEGNTDFALLWFVALYGDDEDLKFIYTLDYEDDIYGHFAQKALTTQATIQSGKHWETLLKFLIDDLKNFEKEPDALFYLKGIWKSIEQSEARIPHEIKELEAFKKLRKSFNP